MILQFKHTTISPLTGALKAATNTATAGNLQTSSRRIRFPISRASNKFNITLTIRI
nr:hypothetical protein XPJYXGBL_XPJYXGBL_CDS_0008 [Microvirus sp.]